MGTQRHAAPWVVGAAVSATLALCTVQAEPYRPDADAQVLERLPATALIRRRAAPPDAATAAQEARLQIEAARRSGDPRFLGYAEGLLRPWWNEPAPPVPVLLLRATLLQSRHEFGAALRDLEALLARDPDHAQALLTQATVLRVQGRFPEAAAACERLRGRADDFVAVLCHNAVRGMRGELAAAAAALDQLAADSRRQNAAVRTWYAAERADMAERSGHSDRALALYAGALAEGADDPLLRASAADLLLHMDRPADALRVVGDRPESDVLRLRAALARRALRRPDGVLEAALADAYAAAHRRGEGMHLRDEARFALEALGDAPRALSLARRNWEQQREPADARLLLAAALKAGQPSAAQPVRVFVRDTRLQDVRIEQLLRELP